MTNQTLPLGSAIKAENHLTQDKDKIKEFLASNYRSVTEKQLYAAGINR